MKTKPYLKFLILLLFSVSLGSCSKCGRIAAVSPDEVHQAEVVSISISGINTSFLGWEYLDVAIIPSDGTELVGQCSAINNNELRCEIEIAEDAMLGPRGIVISSDGCAIAEMNAFIVVGS